MDKARLKYEMDRRGVSAKEICAALGISRSAWARKCSGKSEFTLSEIQAIVDYLKLKTPMGIFFAEKVS